MAKKNKRYEESHFEEHLEKDTKISVCPLMPSANRWAELRPGCRDFCFAPMAMSATFTRRNESL